MHYQIQIERTNSKNDLATGAEIIGRPDVYLHFAHHDFDIVWNGKSGPEFKQEVIRGVNKFFGGMGEGSTFDRWQDALLVSLYDMYQVTDGFKDGDTFSADYRGDTQTFQCCGCHVIAI
jgi:hypothetical protein